MIVAIAGNAVENVVAVQLARKGKSDLAISVVKNSVAQIACFLFPVLVLVSLLFTEQLTFVIDPVFVGALALTAIAVWQITGDGEAVLFEGMALVALLRRARDARLVRVSRARERGRSYSPTSRRSASTSSRVSGRDAPTSTPLDVEPRVAGAPQPHDGMPDRLAHPPHLPVAALVEHELDARAAELPRPRGRGDAVLELDPRRERRDRGRRQVALDVGDVGLLDAVARDARAGGRDRRRS